ALMRALMSLSPAWELERYRPLLRLQARQVELDARLQRRFDASDVVQEALSKAHASRDQFRGRTEAELVKWLHEVLASTLVDEVRKAHAQKRDLALEQFPAACPRLMSDPQIKRSHSCASTTRLCS